MRVKEIFTIILLFIIVLCNKESVASNITDVDSYDFSTVNEVSFVGDYQLLLSNTKIVFHESHGLIETPLEYQNQYEGFNFNGIYQLKDSVGELYYFRFGWSYYNDSLTIFSNVVWLQRIPKSSVNSIYSRCEISLVTMEFKQKGEVSLCTIGDSQTWWKHASKLRFEINLDKPKLLFTGSNIDVYGYPHEGEGGNYTSDVLDRISLIPNADYYTLLLGTNDWENNIDSTLSNLIEIVTILSSKSPESKIIYITPLPTTNQVRDAFNIELSEKIIQYFSNEPFFEVLDVGSEMRKNDTWDKIYIDFDGLHQSPTGVSFMAKLIGEKIRLMEGWE